MLLPGEREARRKADAEKFGIPYERSQWDTLDLVSRETGIPPPEPISG
jgi:hypothetical protein